MKEQVVTQQVGPWEVRFAWAEGADQGGPMRLDISPLSSASPSELAHGISQTVLRQIDFKAAFNEMVRKSAGVSPSLEQALDGIAADLRAMLEDGVTDWYLAHLSEVYLLLIRAGVHNVAGKLAEMVDRTPSGVLQQLKRARKADLLTSIPGKAGGELTPRAVEILTKQGRRSD